MTTKPLLTVEGVRAGYGAVQVLHGVSLEVFPGEIVAVLGGNGAGKTTLLLTLSNIVKKHAGAVRFDGAELDDLPAHELVGRGLVQVPEGRKIFPRLTVRENLEMGAYLRRDAAGVAADIDRVVTLFPVLKDRFTQFGGTLSGGEQQMLAIGRALLSKPKLLLMDEPSMGVAPLLVLKIFEAISTLNREGLTVLLVEQNANLALKLAHRGYVLETGEIAFSDTGAKLLLDPRVQAAYLGAD